LMLIPTAASWAETCILSLSMLSKALLWAPSRPTRPTKTKVAVVFWRQPSHSASFALVCHQNRRVDDAKQPGMPAACGLHGIFKSARCELRISPCRRWGEMHPTQAMPVGASTTLCNHCRAPRRCQHLLNLQACLVSPRDPSPSRLDSVQEAGEKGSFVRGAGGQEAETTGTWH
jgi:hypothetical protein